MNTNNRFSCFCFLLVVFVLLAVGFGRLYHTQKPMLKEISEAVSNKKAIILDESTRPEDLSSILFRSGILEDKEEADFISKHITSRLEWRRLNTLSPLAYRNANGFTTTPRTVINRILPFTHLYKQKNFAFDLDSIGRAKLLRYPNLRNRLQAYEESLGIFDGMDTISNDTPKLPGTDYRNFTIKVKEKRHKLLPAHLIDTSVVLMVKRHWMEGIKSSEGELVDCKDRDSILFYTLINGGKKKISLPMSDTTGKQQYYSFKIINRGHEFGDDIPSYKHRSRNITFFRKKAAIMPLSRQQLRQCENEGVIIVRTPEQYTRTVLVSIIIFILSWLIVLSLIFTRDSKTGNHSSYHLIPITALLTGIGILTLFTIPQHPLQERLLAVEQLSKGLIPGLILLALASRIDWGEFYIRDRQKHLSDISRQGLPYAAFAIVVALCLALFGTGPGGAKVNLLFFQGQPIIKYLAVIYAAIFFTNREHLIKDFAPKNDKYSGVRHVKVIIKMVILLLSLLFFMIAILGDMGPGIVLALTLVIMGSICRGDSVQMFIGGLLFVAIEFILKWLFEIEDIYGLGLLIWLTVWFIFCHIKKETFESPLFLTIILSSLMFGGEWLSAVGLESMGERLSSRTEVWRSPFLSHADSDQLARSIWQQAEAGMFGHGWTGATPVQAASTDFIFTSAIAGYGLLAGLIILGVFTYFIVSSLKIANGKTGFQYYLSFGIIIAIAVQSVFILGGTTNVWVLSGVPLFGMSYGSSTLILDLMAVGALLSMSSKEDNNEVQNSEALSRIRKQSVLSASFLLLLAAIAITSVVYSIKGDKILVQPAVLSSKQTGDLVVEYAPIMENIKFKINRGIIYDRKGNAIADKETGKRDYPKGDDFLFWTGDINTRCLFSKAGYHPAGVLAEARWCSNLRGYDNHPKRVYADQRKHISRYYPEWELNSERSLVLYDYSELLPFVHSKSTLDEFNKIPRHITLTLDSDLHNLIVDAAEETIKSSNWASQRTRFSAAIIDAETGELLASPCWPRPSQTKIQSLIENNINVYRDDLSSSFQAYSDMDLACCYPTNPGSIMKLYVAAAGLRKIGVNMGKHTEFVAEDEKIFSKEPTGTIDFMTFIGKSSNGFAIKAMNSLDLYSELDSLYWETGVTVNMMTPFVLYPYEVACSESAYHSSMDQMREYGIKKYEDYSNKRSNNEPTGIKLRDAAWMCAWGHGPVSASPLAVSHLTAAIINNGVMVDTKYSSVDTLQCSRRILSNSEAEILQNAMRYQVRTHMGGLKHSLGGKTGTAERADRLSPTGKSNDIWFTFFIDGKSTVSGHPICVTLRFERANTRSGAAMEFSKKILTALELSGYLKRS